MSKISIGSIAKPFSASKKPPSFLNAKILVPYFLPAIITSASDKPCMLKLLADIF